ncbi:hypothetical protein BH23ACT5_BH23ACT5_03410 [soil metagenome]
MPHPDSLVDAAAEDGDSLRTDDGRYRLIGINAPERDECLADTARDRLSELVAGAVVITHDSEETDHHGRDLVYVHAGDTFVNAMLVSEGLAIAVHSPPNSAHTPALFEAMDRARSAGVGLWDMTSCGSGSVAPIEIVEVEHDPPGNDADNLEAEYVVVANTGTEPVDLTGWTIRDESTVNRYFFPEGTMLQPGASLTVSSGDGPFGFGLGTPVWNNDGDTVYLVDDQGRYVDQSIISG